MHVGLKMTPSINSFLNPSTVLNPSWGSPSVDSGHGHSSLSAKCIQNDSATANGTSSANMTCRGFLFGIPIPLKPWRAAGDHGLRALSSRVPI